MARNQKTNKGNIPADDGFIEWMQENDALEVLDPREYELFPWAAKTRFKDARDRRDAPWMIAPPGHRCVGKSYVRDEDGDYIVDMNNERIQRPCYKPPMKGMTVCLAHGGGVQRVRKSAVERLVSALDAASGALIKIALDESIDPKTRVQAINSIMDRTGVRGGVELDIKDPGYVDVLKRMFEKAPGRTEEEEEG